jgi:hypothetical protein
MAFFSRMNAQVRFILSASPAKPVEKADPLPPSEKNKSELAPHGKKQLSSGTSGVSAARSSAVRHILFAQTTGAIERESRRASQGRSTASGRTIDPYKDSASAIFRSLKESQTALGVEAMSLRMDELQSRSDPAKRARLDTIKELQARNMVVLKGLIVYGREQIDALNKIKAGGVPLTHQQEEDLAIHTHLDIEMRLMRLMP